MSGGLDGLAVVSLAVGLNFTVAVTSDGRVWQMGETGAPGKGTAWEGATTPTVVVRHDQNLLPLTTVS